MEDILTKACLIQFSSSCWQGAKAIDPSIMEQIGNSEWLRGRKSLIDPKYLDPVRAVITRTRKSLGKKALPFPIDGLTLVPKAQIELVESLLNTHRIAFVAEVDTFVEHYNTAIEYAQYELGPLFDQSDYPVNIRKKFDFTWRYIVIGTPGKHTILDAELYYREVEKFQQMMDEAREVAIVALRTEFADHLSHMVERITPTDGKPKIFRGSMLTNIKEFLDSFNSRDLFEDAQIHDLIDKARMLTAGIHPEQLRDNAWLRHHVSTEMTKVGEELDRAIIDAPRRKIHIAPQCANAA
jgi:hypothetical protein